MSVTEDEMYRQLAADYFHHLRWREKLFGGYLVLVGSLALAFYHTYRKDQVAEPWSHLGWLIPLVGVALSLLFFFLERRCQAVLLDRRRAGQAFEERALRVGLFRSAINVALENRGPSHSCLLQTLYLAGAVGFFVIFIVAICRLLILYSYK